MAMNLSIMRLIARTQALVNGSDTSLFPAFNLDNAIKNCINEFCNATKYTKRVDSVTLAPGTSTLPAMPTGFTAGRLLKAYMTSTNVQAWNAGFGTWLTYSTYGAPAWDPCGGGMGFNAELEIVDIADFYNARQAWGLQQQPGWITFDATNTGFIYPQTPSPYAATAVMSGTFPTMDLASVTIQTPGVGIYSAPVTNVADGFGGTANLTFTLSAGVITNIAVSGSNSLFKQAPNVSGAPVLTANPMTQYTLALQWFEAMSAFTPGTQGTWASGTAYYVGDTVTSGGHIWQCVIPNNSGAPAAGNWIDLGAGASVDPTTITAPSTLPDDVLTEILSIGVPCFLQFNNPGLLMNAQKQFAELKSKYARMAGLGTKGFNRIPARSGAGYGYGGY